MPRSSNAQLSTETVQELENQFFNFLNSLSYDEKRMFFNEFLTNEEKMMMYKRLALYWSLLEGYPLAKIQQMIGVTHDTTRVYNKKKNLLSDEFRSLVKRVNGANLAPQQPPADEPKAEPMMEQLHEDITTMETQQEMQSQEPAIEPQETSDWQEASQEQPQEPTMQAESHDEHHEEHHQHHEEHHEGHHDEHSDQPQMAGPQEDATTTEEKPLIHAMDDFTPQAGSEPEVRSTQEELMAREETQPRMDEDEMPMGEQTKPMDEEQRSTEQTSEEKSEDEKKPEEKKKGGWGKIFGF